MKKKLVRVVKLTQGKMKEAHPNCYALHLEVSSIAVKEVMRPYNKKRWFRVHLPSIPYFQVIFYCHQLQEAGIVSQK